MWKSDIRQHDGGLTDRLITVDANAALSHFRLLLARDDLIGEPCAARLVSPVTGRAVYFSRFDRDLGMGRIHPNAPLDVWRNDDGTDEATKWRPARVASDVDDRPFREVLREWGSSMGYTRQQQADALCVPLATLNGWHAGQRTPATEAAIRLLMLMLARQA